MPIYEYDCINCGKFEEEQNIKELPYVDCPRCGLSNVKRLISKSNFNLDGNGWPGKDVKKNGGQK